jgi:ketosteroid isomerase-like protein
VGPEDLELVRTGFERFNRGDLEGLVELSQPDCEVFIQEDLPNGGHWNGRERFLQLMHEWNGTWDEFSVEPLGFEDAGRRVLVRVRQRARTGELELDMEVFYVFELRDGRLSLWHLYNDPERARETAGLEA